MAYLRIDDKHAKIYDVKVSKQIAPGITEEVEYADIMPEIDVAWYKIHDIDFCTDNEDLTVTIACAKNRTKNRLMFGESLW